MRARRASGAVAVALLLLLPLATAAHVVHLDGGAERAGVSENGHGPYEPCPPAHPVTCVACVAGTLLAPAPDAAGLAPPADAEELRDAAVPPALAFASLVPSGRSPPAS